MTQARKQPTRKKPRLAFAGISLEIPAKCPASLSMDLVELDAGGDDEAAVMYRLITSVIGTDGWKKVRDALSKKQSTDGGATELAKLVGEIVKVYGLEEGK